MKVLHLYNVCGAQTEHVSLDYPRGLAERGHQITIGYETLDGPGCIFSEAHVKLQRVQVEPTDDVESQMEHLAHHIDDPGRRRLLEKGFDLVHGHFGTRVLHGAAWLKRGVPMVVSLYGYDASRLVEDRTWIYRYRWACARGAVFVALCRDMARRLIDHGIPEASVRVIHLGIDLPCWRFDPAPAPARRRFVFVGRLTPKKAPSVLVSALARLRDQHASTADLDVLGSGPLEAQLREQVRCLGLDNQVRFTGAVPRTQIMALLRGATAMVLPSVVAPDGDQEGTPIVLMGAQALGVPCITTRHAGNPEVLPPQAQRFVVSEDDVPRLARAMTAMCRMSNADRQELQLVARRWVEDHFCLDKTVEAYAGLYEELVRRET